jgi:dTMP kinase
LWRIGRFATDGLEPDLTIVLDLPVEQALARRGRDADRVEQRDREYHERVRQGFLTESRRHPEHIRLVDATSGVDQVQAAVRGYVQSLALHR